MNELLCSSTHAFLGSSFSKCCRCASCQQLATLCSLLSLLSASIGSSNMVSSVLIGMSQRGLSKLDTDPLLTKTKTALCSTPVKWKKAKATLACLTSLISKTRLRVFASGCRGSYRTLRAAKGSVSCYSRCSTSRCLCGMGLDLQNGTRCSSLFSLMATLYTDSPTRACIVSWRLAAIVSSV